MAHRRSGFYNTIEYIGPRPQKPKKQNFFGGWVIILIAAGMVVWFGKPLVPFLRAAQAGASQEQAGLLISSLSQSADPGERLAAAALSQSRQEIAYDDAYYKIDFPNGDVPAHKGKAEDVIVRAYRQLGTDLQKEVHEDMVENFRLYPQLWDASEPDTNIDHRRAPNLSRFFSNKGETLPATRDAKDYKVGDVVVWTLLSGTQHIGVVVPSPTGGPEPWIVHNAGSGVKWENVLFDYQILGHFRYAPDQAK
jgi:uncharacterized protein